MSRQRIRLCALVALHAMGCGGVNHTRSLRLDADLAAAQLPTQGSVFSARAQRARDAAFQSENEGELVAADEYASIARAWAEAARAQQGALSGETALFEADAELLARQSEVAGHEEAARRLEAEATHAAAQRAMRDEVARALLRAEADEAVPRRARHIGLGTPAEVAPLADALVDRTRLLLAASEALGAPHDSPARTALTEAAALRMPGERLQAASRAHDLAQLSLADARRRTEGPSSAEMASLEEALRAQGFAPLRDAHGLGTELADAFEGTRLRAAMAPRARRLASLLAGHPHGGLFVLVMCAAGGEAEAQRRAQAMSALLTAAASRPVQVEVIVAPQAGHVRVTLPAYVPHAPHPASPDVEPEAAASEDASSRE